MRSGDIRVASICPALAAMVWWEKLTGVDIGLFYSFFFIFSFPVWIY